MKRAARSATLGLTLAALVFLQSQLFSHDDTVPKAGMLKEKPADLSDAKNMGEISDGEIFWMITKGEKSAGMPPFETKLSEDERWGLVSFMRSMSKSKPNN